METKLPHRSAENVSAWRMTPILRLRRRHRAPCMSRDPSVRWWRFGFAGAALDILSPFAVRYLSSGFAPFKLAGFFLLEVCLGTGSFSLAD